MESVEETQEAQYMRSVKLRAQTKLAVTKAKESEARALAQQNGSLAEELRREQKKLRKAVARATCSEEAALEAQQACKELQYANRKLQQELNSTQVAAKLASDRSSRCMRSFRDTLYTVEVDASSKFTRSQQHVQQLIVLTKRLQSQAACGSLSSTRAINSSSPCQQQQSFSSASMQQVLSEMFRTLAGLGELLTPSPSLLQEADRDAADVEHTGIAADISCNADGVSHDASNSILRNRRQRPATAAAGGGTDVHFLAAQPAVLQAQLDDTLTARAALQHQCADLQWQLQQQVKSDAAAASSNRLECVQQLAEATSLQAERQQLQQQVDALQRSYAASQSALQLLRDDHAEKTSRLAAVNAEVLRLRTRISGLEADLVQQQLDVASALSIVSGREAAAVVPPSQGETSAMCAAQHGSCMQQRRQPWQQAARKEEICQIGQAQLKAALAGDAEWAPLEIMSTQIENRRAHHVTMAVKGQQSYSPGDVAPASPSTATAAVLGGQACHMPSGASELAQQVHSAGRGVPFAGASADGNAQVGAAEQALQQHRGLMPAQPLASPNHCSTVGADASAAAAGRGSTTGRALSPAALYSALVADADAALQRLAECRKVAAAGMNSGVASGQECSPVQALGQLVASRQSAAGIVGGCQKVGSSDVTRLATAGSAQRQLFSSGKGDTGYAGKLAASELLEQAAAAAWAVTAGDTHSRFAPRSAGAQRLAKQHQVGDLGSQRAPALLHVANDIDDSSRLRLHELRAELQAMNGDIEAAEAALQTATARFCTQIAG